MSTFAPAAASFPTLDHAAVGRPITRCGVSLFPVYVHGQTLDIATGPASGVVITVQPEAEVPTLVANNPTERLVAGQTVLRGADLQCERYPGIAYRLGLPGVSSAEYTQGSVASVRGFAGSGIEIADQLQRSLSATSAMVGTYHDIAVKLLEPHGFQVGVNPTPEYWLNVPTDALAFHAAHIGTPFDTIIVDEGQDIYPHWFASLEQLLDPNGSRKLLVVADPAQAIYVKPWTPPADMVEMPLVYNLRNCSAIARLVRKLGGPSPLPSAPYGDAVVHLYAGGLKEVRKRVRDAVHSLSQTYGIPFSQIAVLTTHTNVRDSLLEGAIEGCPLVRWVDRSEDAVLCETVQRTKGLERTAVILVDMSGEPDNVLLYVGVSRAVSVLRLVGPPGLAHALGVSVGASSSVAALQREVV